MSAHGDAAKLSAVPTLDLRQLLTARWILTTLLVIAAAAVMVRLGIWQLDRLQQRRNTNARIVQGMAQPALNLNQPLPPDLTAMEYRSAVVTGEYDYSQEVLLRNQFNEGQPGYDLLTPLRIEQSNQAVLVDRGWIPLAQGKPDLRKAYQQTGPVTLNGQMRRSQGEPAFGGVPDPHLTASQPRLDAYNFINLEQIGKQTGYAILSVYLIAAPQAGAPDLPARSLPPVDLSEGPHLDYAIQWFIFTAILLIGYPFYVRTQLSKRISRR